MILTDIDECQRNISICQQICKNKPCKEGKYSCSCQIGFQLASNNYTCDGIIVIVTNNVIVLI